MSLNSLNRALWGRIAGAALALACVSAWAESSTAKTGAAPVVKVNGVSITESAVARALSELQSQGAALTPQLREQVVGEMVVRQILVSEANHRALDKTPVFTQQMDEVRQRLLVEALMADNLAKNPISEADERAEYGRQKKVLGDGDTTPQYFLSQVVLHTEQQARDVIVAAKSGTAFEKLAQDSVDAAGKANGGKVGWVFPTDVLPAIGTVIVNLGKGTVAAAPIQSPAGWHVIRVDDVRPFKLPSFDEARVQIRQALEMQRRQALVESLLKGADIQRP